MEGIPQNMACTKIVSVSLFGESARYLNGALKLAASVQNNLPEWGLVFFVGNSVPAEIKDSLSAINATLVPIDEPEDLSAAAWRFRIWELGNPDWVIFRDSDSIVSTREAEAVNQWIDSGASAHIIRDHPFHSSKIMAGLWGLRPVGMDWFANEVRGYIFSDTYGSDQEFLATQVYPRLVDSSLVHASFHRHEPLSQMAEFTKGASRIGTFCGESVTSSLLIRTYARLRRLVGRKACDCKK